jgi:hypothetical protein
MLLSSVLGLGVGVGYGYEEAEILHRHRLSMQRFRAETRQIIREADALRQGRPVPPRPLVPPPPPKR